MCKGVAKDTFEWCPSGVTVLVDVSEDRQAVVPKEPTLVALLYEQYLYQPGKRDDQVSKAAHTLYSSNPPLLCSIKIPWLFQVEHLLAIRGQ
nr:hypothetical protein Iba_chr12bCG26070 [Ipomoea batatas]